MRAPILALALIGFGLASCQAGSSDGEGAPAPAPQEERGREEDVAASASDSLRLQLELPGAVAFGDPIPMALRVENLSDRSVDLYLTGRPVAFDLIVIDSRGEVVWRRLEDAVVPAILQIRSLAPGESLEFEDSWDQRSNTGDLVPPGDYTVRGELLAEEGPLATSEETLHIVEP